MLIRSPKNIVSETERIRFHYAKRSAQLKSGELNPRLYSCFEPSHLLLHHSRERVMLRLLDERGFYPLHGRKILDIGCGAGLVLQEFLKYGAAPENLFGIELLDYQVKRARSLNPAVHFTCGKGEELPFSSHSFDVVMQCTVFSSVLDPQMRRSIAGEMLRVLKPDGLILWYDFWPNSPRNAGVRGVRAREIHALFPGCDCDLRRTVLAPPISRLLARRFWLGCHILEGISWLCTHYVGAITLAHNGLKSR